MARPKGASAAGVVLQLPTGGGPLPVGSSLLRNHCGRLARGISPVAVFWDDATLHATRNILRNADTRYGNCIPIRRLRETVSSSGPNAAELDNKIANMF